MDADGEQAPVLPIPPRKLTAVEHPALLKNVVRGLDTFGSNVDYGRIVRPHGPQASVPLFLRHADPASSVLMSHNAASHNVVLAVTVPQRTGMKRKRGSNGPWEFDPAVAAPAAAAAAGYDTAEEANPLAGATLRQRDARRLRRMLQDTAGVYKAEVVGVVQHTHRYRGLFDFQQSVHNSEFMTKFIENILPGDLDKLRSFRLTPGVAAPPNVDLPPPPFFTTQTLPFSYFYSQNPFVREVSTTDGAVHLVNSTARTAQAGYFLRFDHEPIPTGPPASLPPIVGRRRNALLDKLRQAVRERPVWTRRSLVNHLRETTGQNYTENRLKPYFVHVCYQFKGGPWRDTLVRYGVDPRKDPACRAYQTLLFKLHRQTDRKAACWHTLVGGEEVNEADKADKVGDVTKTGEARKAGGSTETDGAMEMDEAVQAPEANRVTEAMQIDGGAGSEAGRAEADPAAAATPTGGASGPVRSTDPVPAATVRHATTVTTPLAPPETPGARQDTHIFDGRSYCDDGKIWQVCDITDPLLAELLREAPVRPTCDLSSTGWYHQGTWAKAKAVMKTRLLAIRFARALPRSAFEGALEVANKTPQLGVRSIKVPVPDLQLTPEEAAEIAVKTYHQRPSKRQRKRVATSFSVSVAAAQQKDAGATDADAAEADEAETVDATAADEMGESFFGQPDEEEEEEEEEEDYEEDDVNDDDEDEDDEEEDDEEVDDENEEHDGHDDNDDDEGDDDDDGDDDPTGFLASRMAIKKEILDDAGRPW